MILRRQSISLLFALVLPVCVVAQEAGEHVDSMEDVEAAMEEQDPVAVPKIEALEAKLLAEIQKAINAAILNQMALAGLRNQIPQVPQELQFVAPPNIGGAEDDGFVLRLTDVGMPIAHWDTVSNMASNVWINIVSNSYYGAGEGGVTNGTANGQVLWWNNSTLAWTLSDAPTAPAVLVYDGGTVHWETLDAQYKAIYRSSGGLAEGDYLRAH